MRAESHDDTGRVHALPVSSWLRDDLAAMSGDGGQLLSLAVTDTQGATELLDGLEQERLARERRRIPPGRPREGAGLSVAIEHAALAQPL